MRGSPPLHLTLFLAGFILLAVPLAHLTFARPTAVERAASVTPSQPQATAATTPAIVRIRFAHRPESLSVKLDGRELVTPAALQEAKSVVELKEDLLLTSDGLELFVNAQWPTGTSDTALSLELEPDGLDMQSQTRWTSGSQLSEAFTFHWNP